VALRRSAVEAEPPACRPWGPCAGATPSPGCPAPGRGRPKTRDRQGKPRARVEALRSPRRAPPALTCRLSPPLGRWRRGGSVPAPRRPRRAGRSAPRQWRAWSVLPLL